MIKKEKKYITNASFIKKHVNKEEILSKCLTKLNQDLELNENDIKLLLDCLIDFCDSLEHMIRVLDNIGVNYIKIIDTKKLISSYVESHTSLIVKFGKDKVYLIDPNYKKFFLKENCKKSIYNKSEIKNNCIYHSPHPGYYYLQNPKMLPIAEEIIENGYIKLDTLVAKAYAESFFTTRKGPFIEWSHIQNPEIDDEMYMVALMIGDKVNQFTLKKEQK